jgi:periplasmic divalent cation tolerance protein
MSDRVAELIVVLCPFPNEEEARGAAEALLGEGLCVSFSLLPQLRTYYVHQQELASAAECLCLIRTGKAQLDALTGRIQELHSYEAPEIVGLRPEAVNEAYTRWLTAQLGG